MSFVVLLIKLCAGNWSRHMQTGTQTGVAIWYHIVFSASLDTAANICGKKVMSGRTHLAQSFHVASYLAVVPTGVIQMGQTSDSAAESEVKTAQRTN